MTINLPEPQNILSPQILEATDNYLIVYKPPGLHSVPGKGENIVDWCAGKFPEIAGIGGINNRKEGECGLINRLDFETQGLILFARNQEAYVYLLELQKNGKIIKEYSAVSVRHPVIHKGFPSLDCQPELTLIQSCFRPFGPGKKEVRPVLPENAKENSAIYETEILEKNLIRAEGFNTSPLGAVKKVLNSECNTLLEQHTLPLAAGLLIEKSGECEKYKLRLRLSKGFRHQIRCHLAWVGYPILNDPVYGVPQTGEGNMALRADSLIFSDLVTDEEMVYRMALVRD